MRSNVAPEVGATGVAEFVLPIWSPGPVFVTGPGLVPVPGPVPFPWSVGDADGLPEPESVGDGEGDTDGVGDCGGLDEDDGDEDVADWDGCVELGDVLGAVDCDADCEGLAVGDPLGVGHVTDVVTG